MSLSMMEWEEEIEKLTLEDAKEIAKAIDILKNWKAFHKHYKWTSYYILGQEIKYIHRLED